MGVGPYLDPSLCFADGDRLLVTPPAPGSPPDTALSIWDIATARTVINLPGASPGKGAANQAGKFTVSPDGSLLAAVPWGLGRAGVTLYSTSEWRAVRQVPIEAIISTLALSADNKRLAIGSFGLGVALVELETGRQTHFRAFLPDKVGDVASIAWSSDSKLLAVGPGGAMTTPPLPPPRDPVQIFSADGVLAEQRRVVEQPVRRLCWLPDSNVIALVGADSTVWLWDRILDRTARLGWSLPSPVMSLAAVKTPTEIRLAVLAGNRLLIFRSKSQTITNR